MPKITIDVDEHGLATVKVEGIKGPRCHAHIQDAETALGAARRRGPTAEYAEGQARTTARAQH